MTALTLATKRCTTCGQERPLSDFYKDASSHDGLRGQCKTCTRRKVNDYRASMKAQLGEDAWRQRNAETVRRHRATPAGKKANQLQARAYKQAERLLREAHRTEFDALYRVARYELGLPIDGNPS